MRFTCSFVTSIFLGLMSVVGLLLVVLQSSDSEIQLGNTHLLAPAVPANEGVLQVRGSHARMLGQDRHHRHRRRYDRRYRQHSGHRKREHSIGDREESNAVRQQWWLADDVQWFDDLTTPFAASPRVAVCHPDAHDAIDMWVGQLEAILGELAHHAQKDERSTRALIAQGLRKIAAGIYPRGITGKVPDAENQETLAAETASNGRNAEPEGAW
ncbi:unnamed protein product [Ectocarpus sp. 8 AP-2014]